MEASIILAKIFGLYLLIVGIAMLVHPKFIQDVCKDYIESPGLRLLGTITALILGIILIVFHNQWVLGWPLIITLLAWLTFLKGVVNLFYPDFIVQWSKCYSEHVKAVIIAGIISIILGVILIFFGFF